ncbi:MAG: hypothetical protein ACR2PN_00445, partial [Luminiphilus sp.]
FRSFFIIQPSFSVPVSVAGNDKGNNSSNEENTSIRRNNRVECDKPKAKCREDLKLVFSNKIHEFRSDVLLGPLAARSGDTLALIKSTLGWVAAAHLQLDLTSDAEDRT